METIGYILAAITLVWLWGLKGHSLLFKTVKGKTECDCTTYVIRNKFCAWIENNEWFNCSTCQCVWIGLILFFVFDYQIFFLPLPLYYGLINKHL